MLAAARDLGLALLDGHELVGEVALAHELLALLDGHLVWRRARSARAPRLRPPRTAGSTSACWRPTVRSSWLAVGATLSNWGRRSVPSSADPRCSPSSSQPPARAPPRGAHRVAEAGRRARSGLPAAPLTARVALHDARFWRALPRGSLALAETLCGRQLGLRRPRLARAHRRPGDAAAGPLAAPAGAAAATPSARVPRNTRAGARRHIAAHYDLGNDLFRLFLDER